MIYFKADCCLTSAYNTHFDGRSRSPYTIKNNDHKLQRLRRTQGAQRLWQRDNLDY